MLERFQLTWSGLRVRHLRTFSSRRELVPCLVFPENLECRAIEDELHPGRRAIRLVVRAAQGVVRHDHGQADHRRRGLVVMNLEVLFEDNHCLAVNKPAGLLSQGDDSGEPSLVDVVTAYLKTRYAKPGNVYVGLSTGWIGRRRESCFWPRPARRPAGFRPSFERGRSRSCTGRSWRVGRPRRKGNGSTCSKRTAGRTASASCRGKRRRARRLASRSACVERWGRYTKLELRPATGRSHQLRVQLASRGLPILGDRKYGARSRLNALDGRLQDRPSRPAVDLHAPNSPGSDFGRCAGAGRLARAFARTVGTRVRLQ